MAYKVQHHCYMACIFIFCGAFLLLMGLFYKSDYCQEVSSSELPVIIKPSSNSIDIYSYNFGNKVILFISIVLMTLGLIPWYIYKVLPSYGDCFVSPGGPESLLVIRIKIDKRLMKVEACNSLVYFILFILALSFFSFGLYKPLNILPTDYTHYYFNSDSQTVCISGFGVYIWIKPLFVLILISSFITALISLCNIYRQYLALLKDRKNITLSRQFYFDMIELETINQYGEPESEP